MKVVEPAGVAGTFRLDGVTLSVSDAAAWVTVTVFGEPWTPDAVTVTTPVRAAPVVFARAVIVKLPGVVPLEVETVSQSSLSVTV